METVTVAQRSPSMGFTQGHDFVCGESNGASRQSLRAGRLVAHAVIAFALWPGTEAVVESVVVKYRSLR